MPKSSATHYHDALGELVCEAAKHNILPILTSFVTIASPQLAVRAEEDAYLFDEVYRRFYPLTPAEVARVYEVFNAQSAAVAREYQLHYADLAMAFPKDPRLFTIDYVHLSADGNRSLAKLLAPHVLQTHHFRSN